MTTAKNAESETLAEAIHQLNEYADAIAEPLPSARITAFVATSEGSKMNQLAIWNAELLPRPGDSLELDGFKSRKVNGWYKVDRIVWKTSAHQWEGTSAFVTMYVWIIVQRS